MSAPASGQSYEGDQAIASLFTNTNLQPTNTSSGILASIKTLSDLDTNIGSLPPELRALYLSEKKFLQRAMIALTQDPYLRNKLGLSWASVNALVPILKRQHA